jgi:hypothetical protein
MYSYKEWIALSGRYFDRVTAAVRSGALDEATRDERTVRGLFVAVRRLINLKADARRSLIREQNSMLRGTMDATDHAIYSANNLLIRQSWDSLTNDAGMLVIVSGMLDEVTTLEARASLLDLRNRERIHEGATTLQSLVCGSTRDSVGLWLNRYIEHVAERQGMRDPIVEFAANIVDKELFGKTPGAPWVSAEWRQATINVVCRFRREIRKLHETRKSLTVDKRLIARKMRKLEKEGAHGAARELAILGMQVEGCQQQIKSISAEIRTHADRLICVLERLDLTCSLEDRLDLFNVNPVDRATVSDEQDSRRLLCVESLEDSAEHRAAGHIDDHPLARALMEKCVDALYESEAGREVLAENISECYFDGAPVVCGPDEQAEATPRVLH